MDTTNAMTSPYFQPSTTRYYPSNHSIDVFCEYVICRDLKVYIAGIDSLRHHVEARLRHFNIEVLPKLTRTCCVLLILPHTKLGSVPSADALREGLAFAAGRILFTFTPLTHAMHTIPQMKLEYVSFDIHATASRWVVMSDRQANRVHEDMIQPIDHFCWVCFNDLSDMGFNFALDYDVDEAELADSKMLHWFRSTHHVQSVTDLRKPYRAI